MPNDLQTDAIHEYENIFITIKKYMSVDNEE